jgi:hypothetical protein
MEIEINSCGEFVGYVHLYRQQYKIDEFPIDYTEFQNRLGWIDFTNNVTKFADELAADEYSNGIVQSVKDILANGG